jgi:hypothetical protein
MNNEINNVVLTGDIHTLGQMICQVKIIFSNWSRFRGIRHAKCHCSRITNAAVEAIQALNPHMKYRIKATRISFRCQ